MPAIADHTEAGNAINVYLMQHGAKEAEDIRDRLMTALDTPSPVDKYRNLAELIYARKEDASVEALTMAADLVQFMSNQQFHGLGDGRGAAMSKAMKRTAGIDGNWPKAENDPAPLAQYLKEDPAADDTGPA